MSRILLFGELLFDVFADKAIIGGAPFNFAAHFSALGGSADLISAVGKDDLGAQAQFEMRSRGLNTQYLATVEYPTGICKVALSGAVPSYRLIADVAYDHIPYPTIVGNYDALYFGTLAGRAPESSKTLDALLKNAPATLVFYDINIRPPFYDLQQLNHNISLTDILKISREEANILMPYNDDPERYIENLLERFPHLSQVVLTMDKDGSMVIDRKKGIFRSEKPQSAAISTVGAGDSFGACYLYNFLNGKSISKCLSRATKLSDFVVTRLGAVPEIPRELLRELI